MKQQLNTDVDFWEIGCKLRTGHAWGAWRENGARERLTFQIRIPECFIDISMERRSIAMHSNAFFIKIKTHDERLSSFGIFHSVVLSWKFTHPNSQYAPRPAFRATTLFFWLVSKICFPREFLTLNLSGTTNAPRSGNAGNKVMQIVVQQPRT